MFIRDCRSPSYIHQPIFLCGRMRCTSLKAEETYCEGPLTETECLSSLKQMADSKTPGTDGLPAEFCKTFWSYISAALITALNAYEIGKLPITQRRGLIKLIPKKETDLKNLKSLRPLSVSNCDYKIAAKSIANRTQVTLKTHQQWPDRTYQRHQRQVYR